MKNLITEEETNNILKMHQKAINEFYSSKKKLNKGIIIEQLKFDKTKSDGKDEPVIKKLKDVTDKVTEKGKEMIDDKEDDGSELSRWWDKIQDDKEKDGTVLNRKKTPGQTKIEHAWESVRLYANQNNLKSHTETTGTHEEAKTYYDIKGTKFYEDGYKMGTDKKLVPYFEDDDALTIVYPDNKPETKIETKPVTTPTPTKIEPETFDTGDY
jgi:hypothetical protein